MAAISRSKQAVCSLRRRFSEYRYENSWILEKRELMTREDQCLAIGIVFNISTTTLHITTYFNMKYDLWLDGIKQ
jgi:hypothetical protein